MVSGGGVGVKHDAPVNLSPKAGLRERRQRGAGGRGLTHGKVLRSSAAVFEADDCPSGTSPHFDEIRG